MKKIIPVIPVSKEVIERLQKARAGLVQERVWVKDSGKKKGHWRMQWVQPGNGKADATAGQIDLFGGNEKPAPVKGRHAEYDAKQDKVYNEKLDKLGLKESDRVKDGDGKSVTGEIVKDDEGHEYFVESSTSGGLKAWLYKDGKVFKGDDYTSRNILLSRDPVYRTGKKPDSAKTDEYKPAHPHLGEFVGHGLGDNGRNYEGYAGKDGSVKYYDKETGNELDENGNMKKPNEKKTPETIDEVKAEMSDIKVGKNGSSLSFRYKGENYKMTKYGVVALATQRDGKTWYSYGGKLNNELKYSLIQNLVDHFTESKKYDEKRDELARVYKIPDGKKDKAGEGFESGKKYRHKTEGWEGEYIGHETRDIATNGKHKLADVPGFKITKPASEKNHYSNFTEEAWGEHKPENFEEVTVKKSIIESFSDGLAKAFQNMRMR